MQNITAGEVTTGTPGISDNNDKASPHPLTQADTGWGTTYERWAVNRVLKDLVSGHDIRSVLEGPGDGMTGIAGINSLILGLDGKAVTLLIPDPERVAFARRVWQIHAPRARPALLDLWDAPTLPFPANAFDLVWNFNIMPRSHELYAVSPELLLAEMTRVTRKFVFICVPNRANYAFWLHRWHHRVAQRRGGSAWDHGDINLMQPAPWKQMAIALGLRVRSVVYLDAPWWPDIVDLGQLLSDFFPFIRAPFLRGLTQRARPENRLRWEASDLPYYRSDHHPKIQAQVERLGFIENSPHLWLKRRFAHHVGILVEK